MKYRKLKHPLFVSSLLFAGTKSQCSAFQKNSKTLKKLQLKLNGYEINSDFCGLVLIGTEGTLFYVMYMAYSVNRLGDLFDFGQVLKAFGNN